MQIYIETYGLSVCLEETTDFKEFAWKQLFAYCCFQASHRVVETKILVFLSV